jgi:hypothetical protein
MARIQPNTVIQVVPQKEDFHTHEEESRYHPRLVVDKRDTGCLWVHEGNTGVGNSVRWEAEMSGRAGGERVEAAFGNQPRGGRIATADRAPDEEKARAWRWTELGLDDVHLVLICVGGQ